MKYPSLLVSYMDVTIKLHTFKAKEFNSVVILKAFCDVHSKEVLTLLS